MQGDTLQANNLFPTFTFSQNWVSLYISWNMAFLLGELDELDILFPKLLIPSLINSKSENAGGVRTVSLWLSTNNYLFRKSRNVKNVKRPSNKVEMSKVWAGINKKYAFDLAKKETHEESKELMQHYTQFFSQPVLNLMKYIVLFFK